MKCHAKQQLYSTLENRLSREYGMWMFEWTDTVFGVKLVEDKGFGYKRLQRFFDDTREGLCGKVEAYTPERMFESSNRGRRKADSNALLNDGIDTTLDAIVRQLEAIGVAEELLDTKLAVVDTFSSKPHTRAETATHSARLAWYELNGKRAIKIYISYILLYMHDTHGYGEQRLTALLDSVSELITGYMANFLTANLTTDHAMKKELERLHGILAEHGIEFEEMPEEDTVMIRKSTSQTPVICANNSMAEFDSIMREVKKSNFRRIV